MTQSPTGANQPQAQTKTKPQSGTAPSSQASQDAIRDVEAAIQKLDQATDGLTSPDLPEETALELLSNLEATLTKAEKTCKGDPAFAMLASYRNLLTKYRNLLSQLINHRSMSVKRQETLTATKNFAEASAKFRSQL
jgi:hypothetical protein